MNIDLKNLFIISESKKIYYFANRITLAVSDETKLSTLARARGPLKRYGVSLDIVTQWLISLVTVKRNFWTKTNNFAVPSSIAERSNLLPYARFRRPAGSDCFIIYVNANFKTIIDFVKSTRQILFFFHSFYQLFFNELF